MIPPPYAADTRAKGWRFELDHERIRQSDTWALAAPEIRPWLLMLWMVAWEQTPCGSLPDDDDLIAARLGMPAKAFAKAKPSLLRRWWKASDGRLYHDGITERVLQMNDKRAKEAARKASTRHGTPAPVPRDNTVTDDTSTGTSTGTVKEKRRPAAPPVTIEELQSEGLSFEVATEWLAHRRAKGSKLTPLAWKGFKADVSKAGWTLEAAITKCLTRGWVGFDGDWVKNDRERKADIARSTVPSAETVEETRARLDADRMTPEQWESAKKARAIALSAIKNITPNKAAA